MPGPHAQISSQDVAKVVASLEPDQLAAAKATTHYPRRKFTGGEMTLLWLLRVYLIFMVGVVLYQVWTAAK